jgi:hypothetical protein
MKQICVSIAVKEMLGLWVTEYPDKPAINSEISPERTTDPFL